MTEKDIPGDAVITPLAELRLKRSGGDLRPQQRFRIESSKTLFYLWRFLPEVEEGTPD